MNETEEKDAFFKCLAVAAALLVNYVLVCIYGRKTCTVGIYDVYSEVDSELDIMSPDIQQNRWKECVGVCVCVCVC